MPYSINQVENKIFCGSCFEVLPILPHDAYDMVFLDPPFNLQLKTTKLARPDGSVAHSVADEWDKFSSFEEYDAFTEKYLSLLRPLMRPTATLWIMGMYHNIFRIGRLLQDMGFWILNDVQYIKANPVPNFKGTRMCNATETIIWCVKDKGAQYTFNYQDMKTMNGGTQLRNDWYFPICTGKQRLKGEDNKKIHPTQKPIGLIERSILCSTNENDIVLDFFAGVCTTAAAAESTNRRYTMVEMCQKYVDAGISRLNNGEVKYVSNS